MSSMVRKIKIEGMHCSSCSMNIDFDLEELDGVNKVNTSYAKQESEVEYDEEKLTIQEIVKQIEKTGYKALLVTEDKKHE